MIRLVPKIFLTAFAAGFFLCVVAGRNVTTNLLENQNRLSHFYNPMNQFYPTAAILKSTSIANLKSDQTLVIIGGNSNFNGVGQNPEETWTVRLQQLLGAKYHVVNLATMGSNSMDLAGVAFRMIEPTRPNTILVMNLYNGVRGSLDGTTALFEPPSPFTYVFWDAYYKRFFSSDPDVNDAIIDLQRHRIAKYPRNGTCISIY